MRRLFLPITFITSFFLLTAATCRHDDNNVVPSANNNNTINTNTPSGKWAVSLYLDEGRNEAGDFSAYAFSFDNGGNMTADKNGQLTTGTWSQHTDDGLQKFRIALNTNDNKLSKLNHNWVIATKTDNEMDLKDDDASGEELHFTRQ